MYLGFRTWKVTIFKEFFIISPVPETVLINKDNLPLVYGKYFLRELQIK